MNSDLAVYIQCSGVPKLGGMGAELQWSRRQLRVGVRGCVMLVKPMIMVIVSALLGPAMGVGLFLLMQVH